MCLGRRNLSRKSRIFLALGNLCMFSGLALSRISTDSGAQYANTLHFLTGFLLGIAIAFLVAAMYNARHNQHAV